MAWIQFDLRSDSNSPGCRECHSLTSVPSGAKGGNGKLYLFGGNDQNVRMNEVHAFDTVQMKWSKCKPTGAPPIPRSAHSTTLVNERLLYTFGGWDGNEELGDLHSFDTTTETWSRVLTRGDKPAPRHFHNACKIHNRLYLFGGYDGGAWRNDVVSLDLETNQWRNITITGERPGVRASAACCVFGGDKMLVFGGYDGREFLDDLWILHTDPNVKVPHRWQKIKPPRRRERHADSWPMARSGHSLEVVDSLVIFFGGRYRNGRFNDVYVLNTDTMLWWQPSIGGRRPQPRKTHATARVGDRIFVVGGHDGGNWLDDMHLLDITYIREQCKPTLSVAVPPSSFLDDMAGMLDQGCDKSMADVVFVVEGRRVKLHRAILAARSEYFKSMLTNGMYETKADEIRLKDVSHSVFMALVRFLYTDQLPSGGALVLPLLHQAQKFGLPRLSLLCQRSLEAQLDANNVAALLDAADTHRAMPLRNACISFILRSFDMVSCTRGFLQLRDDLLREVLVRRADRMPNRPVAAWVPDGAGNGVLTAGGSGSPAAGGGAAVELITGEPDMDAPGEQLSDLESPTRRVSPSSPGPPVVTPASSGSNNLASSPPEAEGPPPPRRLPRPVAGGMGLRAMSSGPGGDLRGAGRSVGRSAASAGGADAGADTGAGAGAGAGAGSASAAAGGAAPGLGSRPVGVAPPSAAGAPRRALPMPRARRRGSKRSASGSGSGGGSRRQKRARMLMEGVGVDVSSSGEEDDHADDEGHGSSRRAPK